MTNFTSSNLEPDKDMRQTNKHRFLFMAIKKLLVITNYYKHRFYSVNQKTGVISFQIELVSDPNRLIIIMILARA